MLFCLFISKLSNITGIFTAFYRFFSFIPKFFPTFASQLISLDYKNEIYTHLVPCVHAFSNQRNDIGTCSN